jgi:hypothetical protein
MPARHLWLSSDSGMKDALASRSVSQYVSILIAVPRSTGYSTRSVAHTDARSMGGSGTTTMFGHARRAVAMSPPTSMSHCVWYRRDAEACVAVSGQPLPAAQEELCYSYL